jgi:hypothetical protein
MEMIPPLQRSTGESEHTRLTFFVGMLALLIVAGALFRDCLRLGVATPAENGDWEHNLGI